MFDEKKFKELIRDTLELLITIKDTNSRETIYSYYYKLYIPPIGSIIYLKEYPYNKYRVDEIHIDEPKYDSIVLYISKIK